MTILTKNWTGENKHVYFSSFFIVLNHPIPSSEGNPGGSSFEFDSAVEIEGPRASTGLDVELRFFGIGTGETLKNS